MHKASPTDMMMMMKMQKDAELDKKIEALRKKNEALMKRYQEVEEDKKRAEQEGMSLHSRKGKPDDLTITLNKSSNEQRVVTKKSGSRGPNPRPEQPKEPCDPGSRSFFSVGRGTRRHLLITTSGNIKGKRVFGERKDRKRPVSPARVKISAEEEEQTLGSRRSVETQDDEGKQDVKSRCEESQCDVYDQASEGPNSPGITDLNLLSSEEEQMEYLRWKKEREEIDRERVARHKNSRGQWRRAWDLEKPAQTYSDKPYDGAVRDAQITGNRIIRKGGNLRSGESRAQHQGRERKGKSLPVVGSKAKGKDRLTGRARRCDTKEQEKYLQVYPDSSLQEFLEELDALCAPEEENINTETKTQDGVENTKPCVTEVPLPAEPIADVTSDREEEEDGCVSTEMPHSETSGLKATEKKVRFSEEPLARDHKNFNSASTDTESSSLKTPSLNGSVEENKRTAQKDRLQDETLVDETLTGTETTRSSAELDICQRKLSEPDLRTEGTEDKSSEASCPDTRSGNGADVCISTEPGQKQPVELTKNCSSRGTEELMDSSVSVQDLGSSEVLPDHISSADMARENGKVV